MIDKITASVLYGYNYKLKDSEGNVYSIDCVANDGITLVRDGIDYKISSDSNEIGTTYKILARPLEMLTKEIEGKVPLIELAKVLKPSWDWELDAKRERRACAKIAGLIFSFECDEDGFTFYENRDGHCAVLKQPALFDKLKEMHFNIGFPENTTTDLI